MGKSWSGKKFILLISICLFGLFIGPFGGSRFFRIESEPHPLEQVPPAEVIPDCYNGTWDVETLTIMVSFSMYTYAMHSGVKGTNIDFNAVITNNGNDTINDVHFWRMTVYWVDFPDSFTTGFTPSDNYTIEPNTALSLKLGDSHDWTGIPNDLCWSTVYVYGRVLVSFNSDSKHILTTGIKLVANLVE